MLTAGASGAGGAWAAPGSCGGPSAAAVRGLSWPRRGLAALAAAATLLAAGCAVSPSESPSSSQPAPPRPADVRATLVRLLPPDLPDRAGWATDLYAALSALEIAPKTENLCAVLAVTAQESGFRADPAVPNLGAIAWEEIDRQAERAGVPKLVVRAALMLNSPDGRSYAERIDAAKTERQLSDIFEDFIGMVPLGRTLLASRNPVRTGGPMQVSVAFAEANAGRYPYPVKDSIRHEVFTRRGGLFFGTAHLLDYPAAYDRMLYRFADFNAGRHASRNAAFQNAVATASGIPLVLDGDLLRLGADADDKPGSTELAARTLATRLNLNASAIRRDLERGREPGFERTPTYERVFALADQLEGRRLPRAVVPKIDLKTPKTTRKLTTEWFAERVDQRYRQCLERARVQDG